MENYGDVVHLYVIFSIFFVIHSDKLFRPTMDSRTTAVTETLYRTTPH